MGYARGGHVRAGTGGAIVVAIVVTLTLAAPTPVAAGGADGLSPVRDNDEAGQQTTLARHTEPDPTVDESPAVRAAEDPPGGISGEVIALLVGFGVLVVGWCAVWRLRPRDARIVVRQGDDRRSPGSADDEAAPERVHQPVIAGRSDDGHEVPHPAA